MPTRPSWHATCSYLTDSGRDNSRRELSEHDKSNLMEVQNAQLGSCTAYGVIHGSDRDAHCDSGRPGPQSLRARPALLPLRGAL